MTAAVARSRMLATGPRRLRSSLQLQTRPVRSLGASLRTLDRLQAGLPPSVMGGDFFSVLSERLRSALLVPEPTGGARQPASRSSQDWGVSPSALPSRELLPAGAPPAAAAVAPGWRAPANSAEPQRVHWPQPRIEGLDGRNHTGDFDLPPEPSRSWSPLGLPEHEQPTRTAAIERGADAVRQGRAEPLTGAGALLAQRVNAYWQLMRSEGAGTRSEATSPLPREVGIERQLPATGSVPAMGRPAWPEQAGREIADRLRAFVSGQPLPAEPDNAASTMAVESSRPDRIEIQNVFHVEVRSDAGGRFDPLDDLSDRLAEILREQAHQHGIDLT